MGGFLIAANNISIEEEDIDEVETFISTEDPESISFQTVSPADFPPFQNVNCSLSIG